MPKCLKRNSVSEDMLRSFFSNVLNPKNVLLNWLQVRSEDFLHNKLLKQYNEVMSLPRDGTYDEELSFLRNKVYNMPLCPYERVKDSIPVVGGMDGGLPFVQHRTGNIFFTDDLSVKEAESKYRHFIEEEGILGTGCLRKHPHSYVTDTFKVEKGDVLLDVGSAEGLFAMDNIDIASKVYVFESMKSWRRPLAATFSAFGNKVSIINKYVGGEVSHESTTLDEVLKSEPEDAIYFIKMDIEGAEREVLRASGSFLKNHRVKLACAAYHRHDDAEFLKTELEKMGFSVEFSDGYVLTSFNDFVYPYFRRGMIYAKNYDVGSISF